MVELTTLVHDLDTGCEKRERSRMIPTRPWAPQGLEICLICLHIFNVNVSTNPVWRNTGFGIRRDLSSNLVPVLPGWLSSVQFSHSVVSDSLQPHEPQHARPPCPSPTPRVHPNLCPLSQWCHPAISSSVIPFFSCLQSFPASRSFQMSQLFASGGQSIRVSASMSVLLMNTQDWFSLGWTGWISLQSKRLSRVFSNTTVQKNKFFGTQLSLQSNSNIYTWLLEKPEPWLDEPLLTKKCLCFLICYLGWS